MNLNKAPLVILLFIAFVSLFFEDIFAIPRQKVVIRELSKVKATGIILTEADMTRMVFEEIEKLPSFLVEYTPNQGDPEVEVDASLIIDGKYELEGDLISISYQINSIQPKMRFKQSVVRVALETVKQQLLSNFLDLFPKLTVISEPTEATVEINGTNFGLTPVIIDNLINGEHLVTVSKEGFFSSNIELIEIEEAETLRVELTKQTMATQTTPPEPEGGMDLIYKTIRYHKNIQNHPFFKNRALAGEVVISVDVNEKGEIIDMKIIKSFGDEVIDNAAMDGVRSVKWKPARQEQIPVVGRTQIRLKFRSK